MWYVPEGVVDGELLGPPLTEIVSVEVQGPLQLAGLNTPLEFTGRPSA